tara:strand:+ start:157 stop:726 length:570 start_codon:yes stop_codon:yes gene_type:complete
MKLIVFFISIGFGNSIIDNWIDHKLKLLKISPLMISGKLLSSNQYSEINSSFEIIIVDDSKFQIKLGKKNIYYSLESTQVYDSITNQLIIDVPDLSLIRNFYDIFKNRNVKIDTNCYNNDIIECEVEIAKYNLLFNVSFSPLDSSVIELEHYLKPTLSQVKDLQIKNINLDNKKLNTDFKDSFIIDLRP